MLIEITITPKAREAVEIRAMAASGSRKLLADFHVIGAGICQQSLEYLMEGVRGVVAVDHVCSQCVGHHTGQIFHKETKSIVQRNFSFGNHKSVDRFPKAHDIDAERGVCNIIARIIKIADFVECLFIVRILS